MAPEQAAFDGEIVLPVTAPQLLHVRPRAHG